MRDYAPLIRFLRVPLLVLGVAALSAAFIRCSPLTPSQSKYRIARTGGAGTPSATGEVTEVVRTLSGASEVLELEAYRSEVSALPAARTLTLSADSHRKAFAALKEKREVTLKARGETPVECKGYLGIEDSAADIGAVPTECVQGADGTLKFMISPSVTEESWRKIRKSLQSVTIYTNSESRLKASSEAY